LDTSTGPHAASLVFLFLSIKFETGFGSGGGIDDLLGGSRPRVDLLALLNSSDILGNDCGDLARLVKRLSDSVLPADEPAPDEEDE